MKTNCQATLYNIHINPTTRAEVCQRTVLNAVYWENRRAANKIASGGDIKSDKVLIMISFSEGEDYLEPVAWHALTSKIGKWTLQTGDIVVKGSVSDEISGSFTVSDLKKKYNDVLRISSVDTMDAGNERVWHWEVSAT